jgi:hypothetical protein
MDIKILDILGTSVVYYTNILDKNTTIDAISDFEAFRENIEKDAPDGSSTGVDNYLMSTSLSKYVGEIFKITGEHYMEINSLTSGTFNPYCSMVCRNFPGHTNMAHVDSINMDHQITQLLYVNGDYEGGELSFVGTSEGLNSDLPPTSELNADKIISHIKPEWFSVVIFPGTLMHSAHKQNIKSKYLVKNSWGSGGK